MNCRLGSPASCAGEILPTESGGGTDPLDTTSALLSQPWILLFQMRP